MARFWSMSWTGCLLCLRFALKQPCTLLLSDTPIYRKIRTMNYSTIGVRLLSPMSVSVYNRSNTYLQSVKVRGVMTKSMEAFPNTGKLEIIQGGMGVAVSGYELAGAVAREGATGLVSGTAIGVVLARRLQDGDPSGEMREALDHYPVPQIAEDIAKRYFKPGGRAENERYKAVPMFDYEPVQMAADLAVVGAFAEVWLAKKRSQGNGHVGMNLLTKIEEPNIHTLYGAMQADVELIAMGAGLPVEIPRYMGQLAMAEPVRMPVSVKGASKEYAVEFDPARYGGEHHPVSTPRMLTIITSDILVRRPFMSAKVPPDGFIIEEPIAGGHNAPPRGKLRDERGQPVYTERDYANLEKMRDTGFPFWLAGGYGSQDGLERAKAAGAQGIQAGSIFALSEESGMGERLKREMREKILSGDDVEVYTDALASPTGFPFKVGQIDWTLSDNGNYELRQRICDLGYLREAVETTRIRRGVEETVVVYRCPSEPTEDYVKKGGDLQQALGRKCICNALLANISMGQVRDAGVELPIVTIGDDVSRAVREVGLPLSAKRIIQHIRGDDVS